MKIRKTTIRRIGKGLNAFVTLLMILQPVSAPSVLRAMAADEPANETVSAPVPDPAPKEEPKEESKEEPAAPVAPKDESGSQTGLNDSGSANDPAPTDSKDISTSESGGNTAVENPPADTGGGSENNTQTENTSAATTTVEENSTTPADSSLTSSETPASPGAENADTADVADTGNATLQDQTTGTISPDAAATIPVDTQESPAPTPEENGDLNTFVAEKTKASSVDLNEIDPTNVEKTAALATDKADYAPTDTAIITGTGFIPGQTYTLVISSKDTPPVTKKVSVTADENGEFVYAYQLDGNYRPDYKVEAKNDGGDVVADTTFTDGPGDSTTITSTATGGNWNTTTTWVDGVVPATTDTVVIATTGSNKVSTAGNQTCAGITINANATLDISADNNILTVNGDVTGSGKLNQTGNPVTIKFTGNWTFSGTSSNSNRLNITADGAGNQSMSGNLTNFRLFTVSNSGGTVSISGPVTTHGTAGDFFMTAGTFDPGTNLVTIGGSMTINGGTVIVGAATWADNYSKTDASPLAGSTIKYTNANPTINGAITYQNLVFNGTGTASASANLEIQGNLANTGGGTLNFGVRNVTFSGAVAAQSIAGFNTTGTVSKTKSSGTATFIGNVNGGGLTVSGNGILNLGTGLTHTFTDVVNLGGGNGTLNGGSSALNENKVSTSAWGGGAGSVFDPGTGTVNFGAAGNQTISASGTSAFNNISFSGSGTKSMPSATTVSGNLSVSGTAKASVATGATISVDTLTLGGLGRINGTWGSTTATTATYKNNTYFAATTGRLNVATDTRTTPTISTLPIASGIAEGQALSSSTLSGGAASVAGSFTFTTPATIPPAGTYSASVTFTPTEATSYKAATGNVDVAVTDTTPPTAPGTPTTTSLTNDNTPTWTWSASDDNLLLDHYTFFWDTILGGEANDSGNLGASATTFTIPSISALLDGTWYSKVKAFDAADNSSVSGNGSVVVDTTKPEINLSGVNPMDVEYGGTYTEPGATVTDPDNLGLSATISGSVNTSIVGDYTIYYDAEDPAGNHADQKTRTVHVVKADAVCSISGYSGTYDGNSHGASGTCIGVGGSSDILSGLDLGTTFTNVPGGTASWTFSGGANYNDQSGDVAIAISKADATIGVTPYDVTYDGNSHTATGSANGAMGESLSGLDLSGTTHTDAGDYTGDTWIFTDVTGNYNDASGTTNDNISKVDLTVTADQQNKTYGDSDPALTYAITSGSLVGADFFSGDLNRDAGEDVGNYAITQDTLALNGNYTLTYIGDDLTIGEANLGAKADNKSKEAGTSDPAFTIAYSGFKFSDDASALDTTPTASVSGSHEAVGNYPIVASGGSDSNYDFTYTNGTLTVVDTTAPSTPTAIPPAGDYTTDQSVALASSDDGSGLDSIFYTLDGTTPNKTKTLYTSQILVDKDLTIKAIAYDKSGNASGILEASYGIAPVISNEVEQTVNTHSVTIIWTTDEPATSRVIYDTIAHPTLGAAPNYDYAHSTVEDSVKVTSHSVTITGLKADTKYYYRTVSHGSPETVGAELSVRTDEGNGGGGGGGNAGGGAAVATGGTGNAGTVSGVSTGAVASGETAVGGETAADGETVTGGQTASSSEGQPATGAKEEGQVLGEEQTKNESGFFARNKALSAIIILLVLAIIYFVFFRKKKSEFPEPPKSPTGQAPPSV